MPQISLHKDARVPLGREARRLRALAIALTGLALFVFALLDTTAKFLSADYSTLQIAWLRYVFHALVVLLAFLPVEGRALLHTRRPKLQFARSVLICGSTVFNFTALATLRLDQAVTLSFAAPFLIVLFASPLLGERIGLKRVLIVGVGFFGVLLVTRPGFGAFEWAYLLAFANAVVTAFYNMATRAVSAYDRSTTSIVMNSVFAIIALAPVMPFVWVWPDGLRDWLLFALMGVFGGGGHLLLIMAHARAPASALAPYLYMELIWMILLGWMVFADVPDGWTLAGAAVVILAGLYLFWSERGRRKPSEAVEASIE